MALVHHDEEEIDFAKVIIKSGAAAVPPTFTQGPVSILWSTSEVQCPVGTVRASSLVALVLYLPRDRS